MNALLATAVSLAQLLGAPAPDSTHRTPEPPVRVLDCAPEDVLPGAVRPRREVTLGSKFDSTIAALHVREGQTVREGEVLATLDDRVARASVLLARQAAERTAHLERARAALQQAADVLARTEAAAASSAAARSETTDARSAHAIALAEVRIAEEDQAQAARQLELARARLEEHAVRAPFDAVAVRVRVEPGATLSPGDPIVELHSAGAPCVDLHLPAQVAAALRAGDRYALRVTDPAELIAAATVRYVEPRIDPISRTMRVVFDLDPTAGPIYPGALAVPADRPPQPASLNAPHAPRADAASPAGR